MQKKYISSNLDQLICSNYDENQFAESRDDDLQLDISKVVSEGGHKILCYQTFVPVCMTTPQ